MTVTCGGSVSGYVLTVTPPTSDCQSSPHCVVVDGSSVYTLSGNETQDIINVNGSQNLVYNMTVRAETCNGILAGNLSEPHTANLTGTYIHTRMLVLMSINWLLHVYVNIFFNSGIKSFSCSYFI